MPVHDLAADGQADTGAFILAAAMQPLEDLENAFAVFFVETDAVVFDDDLPDVGAAVLLREEFAVKLHHGRLARFLKFQRIANQVLQQLRHLAAIAPDQRQRRNIDASAGSLDADFQVGHHRPHHFVEIDQRGWLGLAGYARKAQQVLNERLHSRGRVLHADQVVDALQSQSRLVLFLEPVAEGLDLAQRLLQIVRGDVGELLQFGVGSRELVGPFLQRLLGVLTRGNVQEEGAQAHRTPVGIPDPLLMNLHDDGAAVVALVLALQRY